MQKTKIKDIEELSSIDSAVLFGYDRAGNKVGMIPVGNITGRGFAGVRFPLDQASPVGEPYGDLEKIKTIKAWLGLGGYLVRNDHSRRKLDPTNHRRYESGGVANLDGSEGHYQWGWGICYYYAVWRDERWLYEAVDSKPIKGAWNYRIPVASIACSGASTLDRTNNILVSYCNRTAQYRGGNNDSSKDGGTYSQLGKPAVNINSADFQRYAEKNGQRWGASMYMMIFMIAALQRIVFHNRNIQAAYNPNLTADGLHQGGLGTGCPSKNSDFGTYATVDMDALAEVGDALGVFTHTQEGVTFTGIPCFFGLKNHYHYLWLMLHGVNVTYNADKTINVYAIDVWNGDQVPTTTVSGMTKIGGIPAKDGQADWVYPKTMSLEHLMHIPTEFGGSESTYYPDGFYHKAATSGLFGLRALGDGGNGGSAGSCCLHAFDAPSYAVVHLGAALCEADEDWDARAFWEA